MRGRLADPRMEYLERQRGRPSTARTCRSNPRRGWVRQAQIVVDVSLDWLRLGLASPEREHHAQCPLLNVGPGDSSLLVLQRVARPIGKRGRALAIRRRDPPRRLSETFLDGRFGELRVRFGELV